MAEDFKRQLFESMIESKLERRYQVFVSSTYEDLKDERRRVIQALLELGCFPMGMEFFPAANVTQWELIKRVISECDYYIVIVGARYGSLSPEGISYTQKEYQYAISCLIPVLAFLHSDPQKRSHNNQESSPKSRKLLSEFRELCKKRLCKYWETPEELSTAVVTSLQSVIKSDPRQGWIKGGFAKVAFDSTTELLNKIESLEKKLTDLSGVSSLDKKVLSQGNDNLRVEFEVTVRHENYFRKIKKAKIKVDISWNEILKGMVSVLHRYISEQDVYATIARVAAIKAKENWPSELKKVNPPSMAYIDKSIATRVVLQLCSLGLIESIADDPETYIFTTSGKMYIHDIMAVQRSNETE